ncbi:MAG: glycoside hydrolase family 78 protein [Clostridium sp.]|nr:glycoside hydrolase family 78 protein [Clostridium sp.]
MKTPHIARSLFASIAILTGCSASSTSTSKGHLTDPLPDQTWNESQWISVADAPVVTGPVHDGSRAADGANWFASTITNEKKVSSVKWMTTGLGVYDIYVNGELIGDEILKPGFTHPEKTRRSFTYDVTDAVDRAGGAENIFSVQVTPGWWADKIVTPHGHEGMLGHRCAFRGVIEYTYTDGSTELFGTDTENWTAGIAGKVIHAAIFDGEAYDNRRPEGFESISEFRKPEVNTEFNGVILPNNGAEIYFRDDLALDPVEAYTYSDIEGAYDEAYGKVVVDRQYKPGEQMTIKPDETLVVDFGQNSSAVPEFVFSAKEGTTLTFLPGELLNDGNGAKSRGMDGPEGSVHRLNLRIPDTGMQLQYTFAGGDKPVSFRPRNTFFGYRYAAISADNEVVIDRIASIPVTSISKSMETGRISTGNESVNKLISNTLWGQRSNYLSVPTDCPQRNERLGWTADTQVFTETGTFFANTGGFFHKWLQDLRDSQGEAGGYPGVAPTAQYGGELTRLGWSDAGVIVPWTLWKQFGDKSVIDESWESMEKYMDYISPVMYDHNTLLADNGNYQWADWLSYEPLESCSGKAWDEKGLKPEALDYWNFLSASYLVMDAEMMRDMATATGRDAAKYAAIADSARNYIVSQFTTPEGNFKTEILNTMQTPSLFLLKNNIVNGDARQNVINRLRANFAETGNRLQTGFLGTSILMETLTDNGMADIAYELLFQRENPSWLYSIDNGATTIWERWNSYMADKGMGPQGMNSFNHYAYGCVAQWLWETAAGIAADPAEPGFRHIVMKPVPDRRLGSLDAEYDSAAGRIKSSWKFDGDTWRWQFTIPEGATASVTLPGESEAKDYSAGTHSVEKTL